MISNNRLIYIGGLESGQRGAVGTHTSGIIKGFQQNNTHVTGVFLEGSVPTAQCNETIVVRGFGSGMVRKVSSRLKLAHAARKHMQTWSDLVYHRFDPFISPLVVNQRTILEYNDDVVEQFRFAARRRQWSWLGTMIRRVIYPLLFRVSERICFRRARAVVCVTSHLCEYVRQLEPGSAPIFIPNGSDAQLDLAELAQQPRQTESHAALRLAHVGTLTHWDGLLELLEGLSRIPTPRRRIHLTIVGDGAIQRLIEQAIVRLDLHNHVTLNPSVSPAEARRLLHHCDVVPLLKTVSSYGLSPIKYYEALCLGCFVMCSNIPHINEFAPDEGIHLNFPLNIEKIAEILEALSENIEEIRAGRASRAARAIEVHSWKARVKDLLSHLQRSTGTT